MLMVSFAAWLINRATTHLVNPPDFKIWSLLQLTVPPAVAGTVLAIVPIYMMLCMGNLFVWGVFYFSETTYLVDMLPLGHTLMELGNNGSFVNGVQDTAGGPGTFTPTYFNLNAASSPAEILNVRNGRTGK